MENLLQTLERNLINIGLMTFPTETGGILVQSYEANTVWAVASMVTCWNGDQILSVNLADRSGDRTVTHGLATNATTEIINYFAKN